MCYRFSVGLPFFLPDNSLSYPANFLTMMWKIGEYELHPVLERAMDVLFILHADHEQNCGTTAMRVVGSSHADPYSAAAAAAAALYGPLHGGANEQVVRMLTEIGSLDNVPAFVEDVKAGKGRLMGFGHRVYKNYDPRAKIIKRTADEVFEVTGKNPLLDIALKLEETALSDPYFIDRKLYPNVDFYSGLDLPGDGLPGGDVHGALRDPTDGRLAGPLGRAARGQGPEDLPAAPVVHRRRRARLRRPRRPLITPCSPSGGSTSVVRRSSQATAIGHDVGAPSASPSTTTVAVTHDQPGRYVVADPAERRGVDGDEFGGAGPREQEAVSGDRRPGDREPGRPRRHGADPVAGAEHGERLERHPVDRREQHSLAGEQHLVTVARTRRDRGARRRWHRAHDVGADVDRGHDRCAGGVRPDGHDGPRRSGARRRQRLRPSVERDRSSRGPVRRHDERRHDGRAGRIGRGLVADADRQSSRSRRRR